MVMTTILVILLLIFSKSHALLLLPSNSSTFPQSLNPEPPPINLPLNEALEAIAAKERWDLDGGIRVSELDPISVRVGGSQRYELHVRVGRTVLMMKLSDGIVVWRKPGGFGSDLEFDGGFGEGPKPSVRGLELEGPMELRVDGGIDEEISLLLPAGITFIALVVYLGCQALVKIAAYGIGFIVLVVWLGYQTSMTWLSKFANRKGNWVQSTHMEDYKGDYKGLIVLINGHVIEKVGEIWTWEHIAGCTGLDSEQVRVLRSTVHSVLTQHPSTFDVKSHVELASTKYDQAERMVRFTCKILAQDINAFHKVTEELWIGMKQSAERLADCKT